MVTAKDLQRMTTEITLGVPKQESSLVMTQELSRWWDRLERQVADIKARGREVEVSFEIPDMDPVPEADRVEPVE